MRCSIYLTENREESVGLPRWESLAHVFMASVGSKSERRAIRQPSGTNDDFSRRAETVACRVYVFTSLWSMDKSVQRGISVSPPVCSRTDVAHDQRRSFQSCIAITGSCLALFARLDGSKCSSRSDDRVQNQSF